MDEEMEDFIVECSDVYEIDSEYEFDAARFYDFCRPESTSDAEEAERWFQTAGNYLPSRMISKGRTTQEICKIKPEPRSSIARGSTLMKPTASYLAKQRFQSTSNKSDMTSSQNSLASENIGTKRQKLEIGYLLKIAHMKHQRLLSHKISKKDASSISNSIHSKFKVTVPREPELETLQRAQRRRCNEDSNSSESTKPKTQMLKAQSLNRNIFKDPTLPPLRKTRAPLPGFDLSNSPNADSAAQNALVDFKRPNTQNAVKQGKSLTSLKSRSHKCNKIFPSREDNGIGDDTGQESTYSKESKCIFDEKLSVHPPTELLNKLSLRSEKEAREESQPKKNPSAKKCVGKPNQCAAERGTPRIGHYSSMNRSLGIR